MGKFNHFNVKKYDLFVIVDTVMRPYVRIALGLHRVDIVIVFLITWKGFKVPLMMIDLLHDWKSFLCETFLDLPKPPETNKIGNESGRHFPHEFLISNIRKHKSWFVLHTFTSNSKKNISVETSCLLNTVWMGTLEDVKSAGFILVLSCLL